MKKFKIIAFMFIVWFVSFAGTCDNDESFTNTGNNNEFCFVSTDENSNTQIICGSQPPSTADRCENVPPAPNGCSCESQIEGSCTA